MSFRMIALDVDGTLIDDELRILPRTKAILKRAVEDGIILALCTGRNPGSTLPLMEELGAEGPVIVHNGAFCMHSATGEVYGEIGFCIDELRDLIRYCRERKLHFDVNTAFDLYVERLDGRLQELYASYMAKPILLPDMMELKEEVLKLTILAEEEVLDEVTEEVRGEFPQFKIVRSGETYLDFMHPKVSKGYGLALVCERLGIPLEKVMALGNYYNDIEMLTKVGLGIAMANSPEEVKRVARAVTLSNNDEGVYYAVKRYVFGEGEEDKRLQESGASGDGGV